ncbi:LuxR C-terminal-related transcriptional regulator [Oceanobacillus oncorhynchi]|uniref:LuxR C-terminal-related transcriptional regulator n=1 Tax=Oceanobacillus oncorhynchi TaxID=545501 RepID=UPI0018687BBB|nr:response regulator transcription factor [Oceanobacillus oncorhynchi]
MQLNEINILLIFENRLFREGIKRILESVSENYVVAEGDKMEEAVYLIEKHQPDVLLIDILLPGIKSSLNIKDLIKTYSELKIIVLTAKNRESYVDYAIRIGVRGYLLIEAEANVLIEAVNYVSKGQFYLHSLVIHHFLNKYRETELEKTTSAVNLNAKYKKPLHLLSRRECEVLQLLSEGMANRLISETLSLSEKTVNNHVSSILRKMKVIDRTNAVITAFREGWVVI